MVPLLMASPAFGASVRGVRVESNALAIDVRYNGGDREHSFHLKVQGCLEINPLQCIALLIDDTTDDSGDEPIDETTYIKLSEAGLDDDYYTNAWLTVVGDDASSATVQLP
jgi:hypothetical protein